MGVAPGLGVGCQARWPGTLLQQSCQAAFEAIQQLVLHMSTTSITLFNAQRLPQLPSVNVAMAVQSLND